MTFREQAFVQLRRRYYRLRLAPLAYAAATGALFRSHDTDVSHLASYQEEDAGGPLQRDEALLLYGAVRALRPKTIVEIGFLVGHSAFNFLRAMDDDARLYSFDISSTSLERARELFGSDQRFRFILRSQDEITERDIDGRRVDMIFIDASHDLALNQRTFKAIETLLAPRALVVVHDTGAWAKQHISSASAKHGAADHLANDRGRWVSEGGYAHQPDEREFVNWIAETRPQFAQIHFHSTATLRHGLTMLQPGGPLST